MKQFILLIIFMIFIFAISISAQTKNAKLNEKISLGANQKAHVKSDKLTIEFVKVLEDSRCPVDVDCVWAGSAKVQIKVSKGKAAAQAFELNTNLEPRFITFHGYKIEITDLTPALKSDDDKSKVKYLASFIVRKS